MDGDRLSAPIISILSPAVVSGHPGQEVRFEYSVAGAENVWLIGPDGDEPEPVIDDGFLYVILGQHEVAFRLIARGHGGAETNALLRAVPEPFLVPQPLVFPAVLERGAPPRTVELSWFIRFIYWLVRYDPEALEGCPTIDRYQMISKAALLLAIGCLSIFTWSGFYGVFLPIFITIPLTLLTVTIVLLIDQFIGSSRWSLKGVMREPGKVWREALIGVMVLLVLRLPIATTLAFATSTAAMIAITDSTTKAIEQKERNADNAAIEAAGAAAKKQAWQTILGPLDAEVKQTAAALSAINGELDAARRKRDAAGQQLVENKIKADCQLNGGPGCHKGVGPRYREALTWQDKAEADLRQAEADLAGFEARRADAERKHDEAVAAYHAGERNYLEATREIEKRVADESVKPGNDPVMAYMALQKVFADPERGSAARFIANVLLALLMLAEISYVLVSEFFEHGTIYMVRLIERAKYLTAGVRAHYGRQSAALSQQDGGRARTRFRVVPRFGSPEQ